VRTFVPGLLLLLGTLAGCEFIAFADRSLIPTGTGETGGAPGTGGATTGPSGAGGVECLSAIDCPGLDTDCQKRTCALGRCGVALAPEGTRTPGQIPGDCKQIVCDGAGGVTRADDPEDTLDDHGDCTLDTCAVTGPRNTPSAPGAPCGSSGMVCDAAARCVACIADAQCASPLLCVDGRCVPLTCADQTRDGAETAVDCGGPDCGRCADGLGCLLGGDCRSGVCGGAPRACQAPTCADGVKNGAETGLDCGGSCPAACGAGQGCKIDLDCTGKLCSGAVCLPSCIDGAKNGGETGVDCGGLGCAPCPIGSGCASSADCYDGICAAGACVPKTCGDGARSGAETDVDCGGPCAPCAPGKGCASAADCASEVCAGTLCATPSCADDVKNGPETGADCGGTICGACPDGEGCAAPSDCQSGACAAGLCVEPSCADGVKGPAETDVDCGGPCPPCAKGLGCAAATDCATVACAAGVCVDPTCSDSTHNGDETGLDCGGPTCGACPGGQPCAAPSDCASAVCANGACAAATCGDLVKNGGEADVDCGGTSCAACALGKKCAADADCGSAGCRGGVCVEVLLISEVRTHGKDADGYGDDFIELYNPGSASVTVDATWKVMHHSAQGGCQPGGLRFIGGGQVIPPHRHLLLGGWGYQQTPAADAPMINSTMSASLADAGDVSVVHGSRTVDAVCYHYDAFTLDALMTCAMPYACEGTPVNNLPHDGSSGASSSVDASFERRPGGPLGNQQDTGDNAADFRAIAPANPQNLQSPPTP
jgi:hypothetical protein